MNKVGGFTLIELLVVIAIIGILSSVVLVSLNSARNKGKDARVIEEVNQIRTQLETDYTGSSYTDIQTSGTSHFTATTSATGVSNLNTIATDIASQNAGTVPGLNTSTTNWSLIIFSSPAVTATAAPDYAIYGKTSAGYQCVDSSGRVVTNTSAGTPAWAADGSGKPQCQ